jgi:hypothetical protein
MRMPNQAAPISRMSAANARIAPQSCVGDCMMSYFNLRDCQKAGIDPSSVGGAIACAALTGVVLNPASVIGALSGCGIKCAY